MADKFAGGVETPANLKFGDDKYVDTSNSLEGLPAAAKALSAGTGLLATRQIQNQFDEQLDSEKDYYTKARAAKIGLWEAGVANDDAAVEKYSQQLTDLKIAEKQGLISGSNSQIRQETLLKQTINRYPHREEEIRRMYSSTRARAQAEKEQFKDPVEDGMDQMITRAYGAGRTPAQQIDFERAADNYTTFKQNAEMRAIMGQDLENEFSAMIDTQFTTLAYAEVVNWLNVARSQFEKDPSMTIEMAKGQFEQVKAQIGLGFQRTVNDIVRSSPNPDAVLRRDFVTSKRSELMKMVDDLGGGITSMDQLVAKQRMMEWGKQLGYEKLMKYDPIIAWMVVSNPEKGAAFVFEDWDKNERILKNGGVSELNVLIQNSTGAEKTRLQFQRDMILGWNGLSQSQYFQDILGRGTVPESTGFPEVDAQRVNAVTSTALNSKNATPEMKTNAAKGALQAEKLYSKSGEYVGPSGVWYKDPARRTALRTDPEFQAQMQTEIDNSGAAIMEKLTEAGAAASISFGRQGELEDPNKPWAYYPDGGPFASNMATAKNKIDNARLGNLRQPADLDLNPFYKDIKSLNDMFWIKSVMDGSSSAESWAMSVLKEAQAVQKENEEAAAAEAEAKKKKAEAK